MKIHFLEASMRQRKLIIWLLDKEKKPINCRQTGVWKEFLLIEIGHGLWTPKGRSKSGLIRKYDSQEYLTDEARSTISHHK